MSESYMTNELYYNHQKPFIHLYIDEVIKQCSDKPEKFEYDFEFYPDVLVLEFKSGDEAYLKNLTSRIAKGIDEVLETKYRVALFPSDSEVRELIRAVRSGLTSSPVNGQLTIKAMYKGNL